MKHYLKSFFAIMKQTVAEWIQQKISRLGAALAFYTLFAIAPLIIIVLAIAALWLGEEAAQSELFGQIDGLIGEEGAITIQAMVSAANKPQVGIWASIFALITLFIGATSVFIQLQGALNTIWGVRRIPGGGWLKFVKDRFLSFGLIIGIGFLLLVSLVLSAGLSLLGKFVVGFLPAEEVIWQGINLIASLAVIAPMFAVIFKVLPDVKIAWRDVWVGAILTTLLFILGKYLIGLYLGRSSVASAYGAAGSLVMVLLWVYYSTQILFFGAKFTQIYANRFGSRFEPSSGAEAVKLTAVPERDRA